ncbi:hypothetical protein [Acinetobacter sp.]|uniref:hypothetical protein n=1 Tax=Acinetobacter sp. TaxID=472 RepID=UPI0039829A69
MKANLPQHPCANKCTDFKGKQCKTCLVQENVKQTCIDCGSTDLYKGGDIKEPKMCLDCYAPMTGFTRTSKGFVEIDEMDFLPGDAVVYMSHIELDNLHIVEGYQPNDHYWLENGQCVYKTWIRTASIAEIQANRRLTEAEQAIAEVS